MTIKEIIETADAMKPNAFTNDQKVGWLNKVEASIQTEIWLLPAADTVTYTWTADQGKTPRAPAPWDDMYLHFIIAMIDYSAGEYDKYSNTMQMYNSVYGAYLRWFVSTYDPAQVGEGEYTYLDTVNYDAVSGEAVLLYTLPANALVLRVLCVVNAAFDSGTSDVLILGTTEDDDALMAAADIDETAAGTYTKTVYLAGGAAGTGIYATLTKTGTEADAGSASFYGRVLKARR